MSAGEDWAGANQRYLMARLALVREHLAGVPAGAAQDVERAKADLPAPSALDRLCDAFSLSPFERDLIVLCAGMELDGAQREPPTFSLALAQLPEAHWSAITPAGPLRRWRLIDVGSGDALTRAPLHIDERVLHFLTGLSYLDPRLEGLLAAAPPARDLPASHREVARRLADLLAAGASAQLMGDDHGEKVEVAALACSLLDLGLWTLRAADLPATSEREALCRLWEREALLGRAALLVDAEDTDTRRALVPFLEGVAGPVIIAGNEPVRSWHRQLVRLDVDRLEPAEQKDVWREHLGAAATRLNGQLDPVIANFRLSVPGIRAAGLEVRAALADGAEAPAALLWDACRVQARARLDGLAQRIVPAAAWDDLVLPDAQTRVLRDVVAQVRHRARVHDDWGFAGKGARGLGISALFAGASGTGKTMAAEVLAADLRLDLYRIDLSQVVSKYIGETEKHLQQVFDAAEASGAVLLFDEADALFGKRSEVRDSHDRYANIEVSYLLQRMEQYRGLAVLTTNMKALLDTAFLRRIRFIVEFPFPDAAARAAIWSRVFPRATPLEAVDSERLATLNVPGGSIRNIALHAAFLAAECCEPVRMAHLLRAARAEYAKLEKTLTDAETRGLS